MNANDHAIQRKGVHAPLFASPWIALFLVLRQNLKEAFQSS
jgi:hypothetical protein